MTGAERGVARVAVIGSGPAGIYTAQALTDPAPGPCRQVDVYDRLPVPYGLVRYGVAPGSSEDQVDHRAATQGAGTAVGPVPGQHPVGPGRHSRRAARLLRRDCRGVRRQCRSPVGRCRARNFRAASRPPSSSPGTAGIPMRAVDGIGLTATSVAVDRRGQCGAGCRPDAAHPGGAAAGHRRTRACAEGIGRQPGPGCVHPRPSGCRAGQVLQQGTARDRRDGRCRRPGAAAGPAS